MKRRKKPKPSPAEKAARALRKATKPWRDIGKGLGIPNAEEIARCLVQEDDIHEAIERGRTIGRLEAMMDTFALPWNESVRINIAPSERVLLIPILRREVERLRGMP